jgi:hypothetical protein
MAWHIATNAMAGGHRRWFRLEILPEAHGGFEKLPKPVEKAFW